VFVLETETLTLSVPKKLKDELRKMKDINWSEETRRFLEERVKRRKVFALFDELTKNSQLTEQDAIELGRAINKGMWQKHYKKMI
jgi:ATP-dependent RNA circularization protein (DNA/RNA ligase family)